MVAYNNNNINNNRPNNTSFYIFFYNINQMLLTVYGTEWPILC